MMTKVLARLDRLDVLDDVQNRLAYLESCHAPSPAAVSMHPPFSYGMPYGSTTLAGTSTTATSTTSSAPPATTALRPADHQCSIPPLATAASTGV